MIKEKVCFITTNHISTNPRLVKEAVSLYNAGFEIHIVFTQHTKYLAVEDRKILQKFPAWTYDIVDWTTDTRESRFRRYTSAMTQRIAEFLLKLVPALLFKKIVLNRHFFHQLKAALKASGNLYIAHNVGALSVAADAAQKLKAKFAFDAEDFHRGELLKNVVIESIVSIEGQYLSKAKYITAASPLIAEEYRTLFPMAEVTTIRNTFSLTTDSCNRKNKPLKLFWFSQTVGLNRGIQDVIRAMKLIEADDLELYIYGHLTSNVELTFRKLIANLKFNIPPKIYFKSPVSPDELLKIVSCYDVGLATEPGFCKNNEIALSNKIFTYMLGGNAIIFSNTLAQQQFFSCYPDLGFIYNPADSADLANCIHQYCINKDLLHRHQFNSKKLYLTEFNWEKEQENFIKLIKDAV